MTKAADSIKELREASEQNAFEMLVGSALEPKFVDNALKKAKNPFDKSIFLGILAGFWVAVGGLAGNAVAGGMGSELRAAYPILPKIGVGFFFPFALHFILDFGGELFTGNTMVMTIGVLNRKVPILRLAINWFLVYLSNMAGCVASAYFFGYLTKVFAAEPWLEWVKLVAVQKTRQYGFGVLFLRAIPANILVCMGVFLGLGAKDGAGKFFNMWFPPMLFVLVGFEHSVANMFFVPLGMMYGADTTIGWFLFNQAAVALGNAVGGAIFAAGAIHAINVWDHSILHGMLHHHGHQVRPQQNQGARGAEVSPQQPPAGGNVNQGQPAEKLTILKNVVVDIDRTAPSPS